MCLGAIPHRDFHRPDRPLAEKCVETRTDERRRPADLALPLVPRDAYGEDAVLQRDAACVIDGGADGEPPGQRHLLVGQGSLAQCLGEARGEQGLHRNHQQHDSTSEAPPQTFQAPPHNEAVLVLASASPRRADLLREAGIAFRVAPAHIDESEAIGESPESYVERLAREKAEAVWRDRPASFVLGADTTVVVDETILAKPADAADAARMLRLLSGRSHRVLTGICLLGPSGFFRASVVSTAVTFERLSEADIVWYVGTGEPLDKAGAYAVQGGASRFVARIEGSFSNVVGLPMEVLAPWCREAGIQVS